MKIPYAKQNITPDDIKNVSRVLKSDFLTQGPTVELFEEKVKNYCNVKHAISVNSATSALHIACLTIGLGPNDILWTSPNSFVASANCALYCGAEIDFVDINPNTLNMCINSLSDKLKRAKKLNQLPKVVVPVHFGGQPCNMKDIRTLSNEYNFKIIEDASHAIGSKYFNEVTGNCKFSDITVFSFHPVKIVTTGEGGMLLTNNINFAEKALLFRSHGITRDPKAMYKKNSEPWYYEQICLGHNYRMTDIQAALGISQIQRINKFVEKRNKLAKRYDQKFKEIDLKTQDIENKVLSSYHLYVVRIKNKLGNKNRIFKALRSKNILVNLHYIPIYLHPYYKKLGFKKGYCQQAERYYDEAMSLPLFYNLKLVEQDYVIASLKKLLKK